MGRREPAEPPRPPQNVRRAERARLAKETINKTVPALINSHPRVRQGLEATELLVDLPRLKASPREHDATLKIRILEADTFTAAATLTAHDKKHPKSQPPKVAVLSMASPLRPGGGLFNGATSQEESLCIRSTLYPSLREEFYRLPSRGCIYTPDVLVFRDEHLRDLPKSKWFSVDVISAAALRFPEVEHGVYANGKDREEMMEKMKAVMRAAVKNHVTKVVLGAWGCGAYGNPAAEIAGLWKRILVGKRKKGESERWTGIEEVVFAIVANGEERRILEIFKELFSGIAVEEVAKKEEKNAGEEDEFVRRQIEELEGKIKEKEEEVEISRSPVLRERIWQIVVALKKELDGLLKKEGAEGEYGEDARSTAKSKMEVEEIHSMHGDL